MSNQFFNGIKRIPFFKNDVFIFHFQYPILKKNRHCTTFTLMFEKTPYFMRGKIRILHSNSHIELMESVSIQLETSSQPEDCQEYSRDPQYPILMFHNRMTSKNIHCSALVKMVMITRYNDYLSCLCLPDPNCLNWPAESFFCETFCCLFPSLSVQRRINARKN